MTKETRYVASKTRFYADYGATQYALEGELLGTDRCRYEFVLYVHQSDPDAEPRGPVWRGSLLDLVNLIMRSVAEEKQVAHNVEMEEALQQNTA